MLFKSNIVSLSTEKSSWHYDTFWTPGLLSCSSVSWSVCQLVRLYISQRLYNILLKFCMKLGIDKVRKVTFEKNLNPGIQGDYYQNFGFLNFFQKPVIEGF